MTTTPAASAVTSLFCPMAMRVPGPTARRLMTQLWSRSLLRAAGGWMFQGGLHKGRLGPLAVGLLNVPCAIEGSWDFPNLWSTTAESERDGNLEHSVAALTKEGVGVGDPIERKPVGEQWSRSTRPPRTSSSSRRIRSFPPGHSVVTMRWSPRPAAKASWGIPSFPE